jgi:hypothetical protein
MKVRVKTHLSQLTDGRERFAGREGDVHHAPAGRIDQDEGSPTFGQHHEHAYTVHFPGDGDHAVFLGHELERVDGEALPEFRELPERATADAGARGSAGRLSEQASVTEVDEPGWPRGESPLRDEPQAPGD